MSKQGDNHGRNAFFLYEPGDSGTFTDDIGGFRPSQQAAARHCVLAPLTEAGLTKSEIRDLARQACLTIWDRPASACLSRIAYGLPVTHKTLDRIEQGEAFMASMGLREFWVCRHGDIARGGTTEPSPVTSGTIR